MPAFEPGQVPLARYLSGDCSAEEAAAVEQWLAANPGQQREVDELRHLWEISADVPSSDRVNEMWQDVARQMRDDAESQRILIASAHEPHPKPSLQPQRNRRPWIVGFAAAAILALVVGLSLHVYRIAREQRAATLAGSQGSAIKEYRTSIGQRGIIHLADGTRIELGVASMLRVHPFTAQQRVVELEGEAVFEVVHDATRPFSVRVGPTFIEDLGTRFAVHAYRGDQRVRVVVAEGSVAVHSAVDWTARPTVLYPGDVVLIDRATQGLQFQSDVVPETYFGWTKGRFLFENATLAEVINDLERWYDVKITMTTPTLAARRVTISMPIGSLADVLDAITAPLGITYTRHDDQVSLDGR